MSDEILRVLRSLAASGDPLESAACLPAATYTETAVLRLERERLFRRGWMGIAFEQDVAEPGALYPVEAAGEPLLLTRDDDGAIRVFHNVCRHRGALLLERPMQGARLIRCPYHAWSYRLDGRLQAAPYWGGDRDTRPDARTAAGLGLIPVRSASWCDIVFVNLSADAAPFDEFIAPLAQRWAPYRLEKLRLAEQREYHAPANWKLVVENFLDNYHLPFVHAQLGGPEASFGIQDLDLDEHLFGFHYPTGFDDKTRLAPAFPRFPGLPGELAGAQDLIYIAPNTLLFLEPTHLQSILLQPRAVAATRERFAVHVMENALANEFYAPLDALIESLHEVNRQDMPILRRLQAGRASAAADEGRFAPVWDGASALFQRRLLQQLAAEA